MSDSAPGRPRSMDDRSVRRSPGPGVAAGADPTGDKRVVTRVPPVGRGRVSMQERALLPTVLGLPALAAVGLAAVLTGVGVTVDLLRIGTLSTAFSVCYVTGCVLGVLWVERRALFWPMVVPPLLIAAAVPVVVGLQGSGKPGGGLAGRLLVVGAPLVNAFPVMAWTTGIVVGLGVARMLVQRPRPARPGRAAARGATRTSASPRRS